MNNTQNLQDKIKQLQLRQSKQGLNARTDVKKKETEKNVQFNELATSLINQLPASNISKKKKL